MASTNQFDRRQHRGAFRYQYPDIIPLCTYHLSPRGCALGQKCNYKHEKCKNTSNHYQAQVIPKKYQNIPQKYRDTVHGFLKRKPDLISKIDGIKYLILLYYFPIFESNLLSDDDRDKLIQLLQENDKEILTKYPWQLLWDSRKGKINGLEFMDKVYDKPNIFIIIQLKGKGGPIIGGYTKVGWDKEPFEKTHNTTTADKDAFIFHLKPYEPFISNILQNDKSIKNALGYLEWWSYCCFGNYYYGRKSAFYIGKATNGKYWFLSQNDSTETYKSKVAGHFPFEQYRHGKRYLSGADPKSNPQMIYDDYEYTESEICFEVFQVCV